MLGTEDNLDGMCLIIPPSTQLVRARPRVSVTELNLDIFRDIFATLLVDPFPLGIKLFRGITSPLHDVRTPIDLNIAPVLGAFVSKMYHGMWSTTGIRKLFEAFGSRSLALDTIVVLQIVCG